MCMWRAVCAGKRHVVLYPVLFQSGANFGSSLHTPAGMIAPHGFEIEANIFCMSAVVPVEKRIPSFKDNLRTPSTAGDFLKLIVPSFRGREDLGGGSVAVVGGSTTNTGAPYYAGMAALRVGAEAATILTSLEVKHCKQPPCVAAVQLAF